MLVFFLFAHRSMMTALKDIPFCLQNRNEWQKNTNSLSCISIAFFIGHLDTPAWNAGIACLNLMHQISYFLRVLVNVLVCMVFFLFLLFTVHFNVSFYTALSSLVPAFIFGIPRALQFDKLTLSEKYCLFFPQLCRAHRNRHANGDNACFGRTDRSIVCNVKCCCSV